MSDMLDWDPREIEILGIHRGKVFYLRYDPANTQSSVRKIGKHENVIEVSSNEWRNFNMYANDSSPLIYITRFDNDFVILDSDIMEFLPPLRLGNLWKIRKIAYVHNEVIVAHARAVGNDYLVTAQLPYEFASATGDCRTHEKDEDKQTCSSSTVRMCIKEDCGMHNQLLCLVCTLDGGHGGHVVKYDVKMEKVR
ncbi:hypothetical protein PMAYCL1PPCAC_09105, partial [Pristionchus mayeri]